jgi:hypothetical protein
LGKDFSVADVATVDDVVTAPQERNGLWPEQAMGVGNQADACHRLAGGGKM